MRPGPQISLFFFQQGKAAAAYLSMGRAKRPPELLVCKKEGDEAARGDVGEGRSAPCSGRTAPKS